MVTIFRGIQFKAFFVISIFVTAFQIHAQSTAEEWYQKALEATEPGKKVFCLQQAVEIDPNFAEAHYLLGSLYNKQGQSRKAIEAFEVALAVDGKRINSGLKLKILYELGITCKKMDLFDAALTHLIQANKLADTAPLRGATWYEIGMISLLQKQYQTAIQQFQRGARSNPDAKEMFQKAILQAENKQNAETAFQRGVDSEKQQQWDAALKAFKQVAQLDPEYPEIETRILQLESKTSVSESAGEPEPYQAPQKSVEPASVSTGADLEADYQKGIRALRNHEYLEAFLLLEKIRAINPGYKNVRWAIAETKKNINQAFQPQSTILENYYQQGQKALAEQKWGQAILAFELIQQMDPRYKDSEILLHEAREKHQLAQEVLLPKLEAEFQDKEAQLYFEQGMASVRRKAWIQAVIAFEKAIVLRPELPELQSQLELARQKLNQQEADIQDQQGGEAAPWSVLIVMLAVGGGFGFGLLYFIPTVRARFYLTRGDFKMAKQIYEGMLMTRPGDPRVYITLANIYLLENRQDEKALRIYDAVMRMNLDSRRNENIQAILARHNRPVAPVEKTVDENPG